MNLDDGTAWMIELKIFIPFHTIEKTGVLSSEIKIGHLLHGVGVLSYDRKGPVFIRQSKIKEE